METTSAAKLEWASSPQVTELPIPALDAIKLKELELRHQQKLHAIEEGYYNGLVRQKTQISNRLRQEISDYSRELLVNKLKEVEDEIRHYALDNSKIIKLTSELALLHENANKKQKYTGELKLLKVHDWTTIPVSSVSPLAQGPACAKKTHTTG